MVTTNPAKCPICKTSLKTFVISPLVSCEGTPKTASHKFTAAWGTTTDVELVLAVDADGYKAGHRFPLPNGAQIPPIL
jgi:hypothetical protein